MGWSSFIKVKKIGEGSFGAAWLVKGIKDNTQYVIKIINVSRMPTKEREEARKEVAVLAQMKHPNIVSYIDSFEESGNLCIVMDYCDGGDLYAKIHSTRGMGHDEEQIIDWFVQITLALKHVHDRKILHRDLKTQNIFLTRDGTVKLGDFGVAKVLTNTMDFARTSIGTPYYMSPELVEHKPYNNKSDVWSLGCVLYEMTNMKHPFTANNMQMLAHKILRGNYEPVLPKFSYELRNLISSMLKRNPRERPSVNGILRKAFVSRRCDKFLTNEKMKEEFSHTVLHGENFARKIQNLDLKPKISPTPRPSSNNMRNAMIVGQSAACASPLPQKHDPSKIYNAPVVKRADQQVRKSVEKRNAAYLEMRKKSVAGGNRASSASSDVSRKSAQSYLEQLKEKKQREEVLAKEKLRDLLEKQKEKEKPRVKPLSQNNIYARHQRALEERRNAQKINPNRYSSNNNIQKKSSAVRNSPAYDFKRRKEEFLANQARGKAAANHPLIGRHPIISKKDDKSDYEDKLRKIRNANYNNRKPISNGKVVYKAEAARQIIVNRNNRMQKIQALKKQGEDQLNKISSEMDRKKKEALEKEKIEVKKLPEFVPIKPIGMTEALSAIGVAGKKILKAEVIGNPVKKSASVEKSPEVRQSWQQVTNLESLDEKTIIQPTIHPRTLKQQNLASPRKVWDLPHETIIKAFELADLSPSSTQTEPTSSDTKQKEQSKLKRGETFVIDRKESQSSEASTDNNIKTENVKPCDETKLVFSPDKLATLKMTKNLLLGVTLGQFDSKSVKLLRTCSEPDMTQLFKDEKEESDETDTEESKQIETLAKKINCIDLACDKNSTIRNTKRLIKSLDQINTTLENESEHENSSNDEENASNSESDSDVVVQNKSEFMTQRNNSNSVEIDFDDVSEVGAMMQSFLKNEESDEEKTIVTKKSPEVINKRAVSFVSASKLVSAKSVTIDPVDSLEVSRKTSNSSEDDDEKYTDNVVLNGGDDSEESPKYCEDSDTEFEDDVVITIEPNKTSSSSAEENRISLEENLGAKDFIMAYPLIEKLVLKEESDGKTMPKKSRKSYETFRNLFPNAQGYLYDQFYSLVLSDNDLNQ